MSKQTESTAPLGVDSEMIADVVDTVRDLLAARWPDATRASGGDIGELWAAAAAQGWTELGEAELLPVAVAIQQEMGRVALPLPIVDVALAACVARARGDEELVAAIGDGSVRPVLAYGDASGTTIAVRAVECADAATHLLLLDDSADMLAWVDLAGASVSALPGLAVPAWSEVRTTEAPEWTEPLSAHPELAQSRRIGLAARATAAARRTHAQALEHAINRKQFGKQIGAFQAVSHRLVNAEIALTAADELLNHALELRASGSDDWTLAAAIYIEFVASRVAGIAFDSHHTLAAIGYFEESEGPWLFRRTHADLAALSGSGSPTGVGEQLIGASRGLPDWDRGASAERVRREVLSAFEPWRAGAPSHLSTWDDRARDVLRERGWIGVNWPAEVGGAGWRIGDVLAFSEALAYVNPPLGNIMMGINSIAPMVIKVGSPDLQELVLREVRKGELSIALGYSEPEAGSDLASLRTRADRVDGGWLINGQKMWGTCFPDSRWAVVAARTDQTAQPPHAGISLFLVDTDTPGLTITPHKSLGGDVSATTFWDDVFVPEERLIGAENEGWAALSAALAGERVLIGASVMRTHRAFERLVALVAARPEAVVPSRRADAARELGRLAVRLQAARALVNRAVRAITEGAGSRTAAPMAKIAATEFAEDLNATALALLGPDALYAWGVDGGAGDGYFEDGLRASIMGVIAGGTGDIQRNLVARGMGLPR